MELHSSPMPNFIDGIANETSLMNSIPNSIDEVRGGVEWNNINVISLMLFHSLH